MNTRHSAAILLITLVLVFATPRWMNSTTSAHSMADKASPEAVMQSVIEADATSALHALFDEEWQRQLKDSPVRATYFGDKRYNHLWPDESLEAHKARIDKSRQALKRLSDINTESLNDADKLNHQLFKQEYENNIRESEFERYLIPLNQRGGIQSQDTMLESMRFTSEKDYSDWLQRLETFPVYMQQTISLMKHGMSKNIVPPKIIMQRIPDQIKMQLVDDPTQSSFYKPFKTRPEFISENEWKPLTKKAQTLIKQNVVTAYQDFHDFITADYLPVCRESVGAWDSPNGMAYYDQRVARYTTTPLTADEIHHIGLSEVKRIRGEMQKIIEDIKFKGSFNDFLVFLRTDEQFYYKSPEALEKAYLETSKRIDPELVHLFGKLPRMPYGIKKIADSIAPDTTTAYYSQPAADGTRAGYFYVNLYKPETRPKYEIEVLTVHEAMPGHHLQIALAQELGELPNFRRHGGFTAFVEGWGLYSESLGGDLGLYKDPYSKFGQLTYEMWRAVRLVVDTGMHSKKWSRQQAIDFFKANAAKTEHDIVNEIDRYIAWPGQALAYKIGELKIKELRARSEKALGDDFNIKEFHDLVLSKGAIPLNVLEDMVDEWLTFKL